MDGGWQNPCTGIEAKLTNPSESRQEIVLKSQYDKFGGEKIKFNLVCRYHIQ